MCHHTSLTPRSSENLVLIYTQKKSCFHDIKLLTFLTPLPCIARRGGNCLALNDPLPTPHPTLLSVLQSKRSNYHL